MTDSEHSVAVNYATLPSRAGRAGSVAAVTRFTLAMVACTVVCTVLWQTCVTDVLYHCSDSVWLDYLQGPSGWVHGTVAGQSGNFGDTIRPGWSFGGLKALWLSLLAVSVTVSLVFSRIR